MRKSIIFIFVLCSVCWPADIYVSHAGSDGSGDGTVGTPYRSIQKAIDGMSGGDVVKLVNDANPADSDATNYTQHLVKLGIVGAWSTGNKYFLATGGGGGEFEDDAYNGMVAYFTTEDAPITGDVYAYKINDTVNNQLAGFSSIIFTAAELSGREPGDGDTITLVGIGDQNGALILDNSAGDPATDTWLTITSADTSDQSTIKVTDLRADQNTQGVYGGANTGRAIDYLDDNYIIDSLVVEDGVAETQDLYIILDTDAGTKDGLIVRNCAFNFIKGGGPHMSDTINVQVLNNTFSLSAYTGHTTNIASTADGLLISGNTFDGSSVVGTGARNAIVCGATGAAGTKGDMVIDNNIIFDFVQDVEAAGGNLLSGILINNKVARVSNNTFYNIEEDAPGGASQGAIHLIASADVKECYNNIIVNCSRGITIQGGSLNADFNCIFNSGIADYTGTTAGTHDLNVDPDFADAGSADFSLNDGSPCKYTGKSAYREPKTDMGFEGPFSGDLIVRGRHRYIKRGRY